MTATVATGPLYGSCDYLLMLGDWLDCFLKVSTLLPQLCPRAVELL